MSSLVFGTAPAGVNLADNAVGHNNAAVISVLILATIAVALRCWSRKAASNTTFEADDWCCMLALIVAYGTGVCCILGGTVGVGRHVWAVAEDDVVSSMRIIFVYIILYATTVFLVKMSCILLYRRIFGHFTWPLLVCVGLSVAWWMMVVITICASCQPTTFYWTQFSNPLSGGKCIDLYKFYLSNAIANMLIDVIILCVPMPVVWKLQMPGTQKLAVSGIFFLGAFVCVASLVRIYTITKLGSSVDITWVIGDAFIWSNIEPCVGIISACLPTLRPLLRHFFGSSFGSSGVTGSSRPGLSGSFGHSRAAKSGTINTDNHIRLKSRSSSQDPSFRPADDEVHLTTDIGRGDGYKSGQFNVDTNSGRGGNTSDDDDARLEHGYPMTVQVKRDISYKVERMD